MTSLRADPFNETFYGVIDDGGVWSVLVIEGDNSLNYTIPFSAVSADEPLVPGLAALDPFGLRLLSVGLNLTDGESLNSATPFLLSQSTNRTALALNRTVENPVEIIPLAPNRTLLALAARYVAVPRLAFALPSAADVSGGVAVTLRGEGFVQTPFIACRWEARATRDVIADSVGARVLNPNTLLCVLPRVQFAADALIAATSDGFAFSNPLPFGLFSFDGKDPEFGSSKGGTVVILTGFRLTEVPLTSNVSFCVFGAQRTPLVRTAAEVTCLSPPQPDDVPDRELIPFGVAVYAQLVPLGTWFFNGFVAPIVFNARFRDDLASIYVTFDTATDRALASDDITPAQNVLTPTTVALLGGGAYCVWPDDTTLLIFMAADSSITVGSLIQFLENRIGSRQFAAGETTQFRTVTGYAAVNKPIKPIQPTAVAIAPSVSPQCREFLIDGTKSQGGGGRALIYFWDVVAVDGYPILHPNITDRPDDLYAAVRNSTGPYLTCGANWPCYVAVPPTQTMRSVTFRLTVKNWLGTVSAPSTVTVRVTDNSSPVFMVVKSSPRLNVAHFAPLVLKADLDFNACGGSRVHEGFKLSFVWTVRPVRGDLRTPGLILRDSNTNAPNLLVNEFALLPNAEYLFSAVVALKSLTEPELEIGPWTTDVPPPALKFNITDLRCSEPFAAADVG
jgi:hypothetical protein